MKKTAIFEDIISIMSHDSSTIKDRKDATPIAFEKKWQMICRMMPFFIKSGLT